VQRRHAHPCHQAEERVQRHERAGGAVHGGPGWETQYMITITQYSTRGAGPQGRQMVRL
jgi:hypothetical protein